MADREFLTKITRAKVFHYRDQKYGRVSAGVSVNSKTVNYECHFYAVELLKRFDLKKICLMSTFKVNAPKIWFLTPAAQAGQNSQSLLAKIVNKRHL